MIEIKDLLVNFNEDFYSFYEWYDTDDIEFVKKSILFKINDYLYNKFINNSVIMSNEFLNKIKNKSEFQTSYSKNIIKYCCFVTSGYEICGVIFDNSGKIIKLSSLYLDDELEILKKVEHIKEEKIEYHKIMNINYNKSYFTREELTKIKIINKELEKIKNQEEKIKYLYFEWFNKKARSNKYYEKLLESINSKFTEKHDYFLNILKLISLNA